MEYLELRNSQAPGDVVMLTAAVRDLYLQFKGRFHIKVKTQCPTLWENNPYVVQETTGRGRPIVCHYPLIHRSNQSPWHFIHGFHQYLSEQLGVRVEPTAFKGDIHLSADERARDSQIVEMFGVNAPFWIVVSGGKTDFTAKWWAPARMQTVVDHCRGRILFVQVGEADHHHPPLRGVLDLRGKTTLRELAVLMHHAQGVICPVTLAMHLAAAVDTKTGMPPNRPCVVIAGGREPMQWEAYPFHQYIHTNGALSCCATGGCWRSRVVPLRDGDEKDRSLCAQVVRVDTATGLRLPEKVVSGGQFQQRHGTTPLPRCLDMISADEVIRRTELYFEGGAARYLTRQEARACAERIPSLGWHGILRASVPGADLEERLAVEENVDDDGWARLTRRPHPEAFSEPAQRNSRPQPMSATTRHHSRIEREHSLPRPPLTLCILLEGKQNGAFTSCLQAIQRNHLRHAYRLLIGSVAIDPATRESLRRLRMIGAIDRWEARGGETAMADILKAFLAEDGAEFFLKLPASEEFASRQLLETCLARARNADNDRTLWFIHSGNRDRENPPVQTDTASIAKPDSAWFARGETLNPANIASGNYGAKEPRDDEKYPVVADAVAWPPENLSVEVIDFPVRKPASVTAQSRRDTTVPKQPKNFRVPPPQLRMVTPAQSWFIGTPEFKSGESVMFIACDAHYDAGNRIGDTITMAQAARLMAQHEPHDHYILSLNPKHPLNFVFDKFVRDYAVSILHDDWPNRVGWEIPEFNRRQRQRVAHGVKFTTYKELYRRIDGGMRQGLLCGAEKGLGRRNIFEYYFFGQETSPTECPNGADFGPEGFGFEWNPVGPKRSVFVAPHAVCQGNHVFTMDFWKQVIDRLLAADVIVTVNTPKTNIFGEHENLQYSFKPNDFRALFEQIQKQRLVMCGNTGIGWIAGACGVPLIAGEPPFFHIMDYRYRECGVRSLVDIFSEPDPDHVAGLGIRTLAGERIGARLFVTQ